MGQCAAPSWAVGMVCAVVVVSLSLSIAAVKAELVSLTRDPCRPPLPARLGSCVNGTGPPVEVTA